MDLKNTRHCVIYIVVAGFAFYLLMALLSVLFIYPLPLADDFYADYYETEHCDPRTGEVTSEIHIAEFKNNFEMRKFYHNETMRKRRMYLLGLASVLLFTVTWIIFYAIPQKNPVYYRDPTEPFWTIVAICFFTICIVSGVFAYLLPPPIEWFPKFITDINSRKVEELLMILK